VKKRFAWAAVGLIYAVIYGFWTALLTGGGHGNFLWLVLFLLTYFFGGIFPAMGFILADLRPIWAKSAGLAISLVSAALTVFQLCSLGPEGTEDLIESWNRSAALFVVASLIHVLPLAAFIVLIFRSFFKEQDLDLS
jgi:hypothetical protein